jgi:putative addiction module component (TIGR02574 family)
MTKLAEQILEQAKTLSDAERAEVAEQLLEAVAPSTDPAYQVAWEAEIQRRIDDFESGKTQGVPWEQVRERMRQLGRRDE